MSKAIVTLIVLLLVIAIRIGFLAGLFYVWHISVHTDLFTAAALVIFIVTDVKDD